MKFIWKNIVCHFGVPRVLILDNRTQFQGKKIIEWCKEIHVWQNFTSIGNPQANGQTEVTNRTILQNLKIIFDGALSEWVEEQPGVLWVYRTTPRTSTGEIPFYGLEVVIPAEIGSMTMESQGYNATENREARMVDL